MPAPFHRLRQIRGMPIAGHMPDPTGPRDKSHPHNSPETHHRPLTNAPVPTRYGKSPTSDQVRRPLKATGLTSNDSWKSPPTPPGKRSGS